MCGLVGIITPEGTKNFSDRKKLMSDLLIHDTIRGRDSTGTFWVPHESGKEVWWHKKAIPGWDYVNDPVFTRLNSDIDKYRYVIGHNRAATVGRITSENAHPFSYGNILGVHNGTVNNKWELPDGSKFNVDSAAIMNALNEWEVDRVIGMLKGAFALIWYDSRTQNLNVIRNEMRPLCMFLDDKRNLISLASEVDMLAWLHERNDFKLSDFNIFKPGVLYQFPRHDPLNYTTREVELRKEQVYQGGYSGRNFPHSPINQGRSGGNGNGKKEGNAKSNLSLPAPEKGKNGGTGEDARVKKLERAGLVAGQEVECMVNRFIPYSEGFSFGYLEAEPLEDTETQEAVVIVHSIHVTSEEEAREMEWQLCSVKLTGATHYEDENKTTCLIAYGDTPSLKWLDQNSNVIDMEKRRQQSFDDVPFETDKDGDLFDPDDPSSYIAGDHREEKEEERVADGQRFFRGPNGEVITKKEWEDLTRQGCRQCPGNILDEDHERISWTVDGDPVCSQCVEELHRNGVGLSSLVH